MKLIARQLTLQVALALAALGTTATQAHAQAAQTPDGSLGQCWMKAKIKIASNHLLILGGSEGWGRGKIVCDYYGGGHEELPILIHSEGTGIGLGASRMQAHMVSTAFGVTERGVKGLLGTYSSTKLNVAIGPIGGEFSIGLALQRDMQSIPVDLKGKVGIGLEADIDLIGSVTILPEDGRRLPEPQAVYIKD